MPDEDETVIPRMGTDDVKRWAKFSPIIMGIFLGGGGATGAFSNFDFMGIEEKNSTIARCEADKVWLLERNKYLMQSLGVDLGASFVPPTPGMFWIDEPELVQ